jgi:hypothetical protein
VSANRRNFPKSLLGDKGEMCSSTVALQQDHWDNNRMNNAHSNHKTLCDSCNTKKYRFSRGWGSRAPNNTEFLNWVAEQKKALGDEGFRISQERLYEFRQTKRDEDTVADIRQQRAQKLKCQSDEVLVELGNLWNRLTGRK